jgi:predicted HTH domain antitoxin
MIIELDDEIISRAGLSQQEVKECLAVALYKLTGMHGTAAGRLLGISEFEFHGLLGKYGVYVNYDVEDLARDMETLKQLDDEETDSRKNFT